MPMKKLKKYCDMKVKQANGKDHSDIFVALSPTQIPKEVRR